jgi:drug/metabolite transporter (DMT)-like permease
VILKIKNILKNGALLMVLSSLFFSFSYIFIKKSTQILGFWEVAFFRGVIGTIFVTTYLKINKIPMLGKKENRIRLIRRGVLGSTAMILYFFSFQLTSLANASSLHFTHPLFTTLLAVPLLKEKVNKSKIVMILIALCGVFLIFRPDMAVISMGSLAALISGFFASLAYISVRDLTSKEPAGVIINYLMICVMVITLPFVVFNWSSFGYEVGGYLLLVGILTTIAQYLMTTAYKLEPASNVAGFSFVAIFWAILMGKLVFGELPGKWEFFGTLLIFISMVGLVAMRNRKKSSIAA